MPPVIRTQLDYYAVLEIDRTAGVSEIGAAFRRLAWRYHPDRNPAPGATLQFQDINEAHQVLSDPARRAEYDARWHPDPQAHHRTSRPQVRLHSHRASRRRRRIRTALLSVFAFVFVTSAWVVIFAAMDSAHSLGANRGFDGPSTFSAEMSQSCAFSMEMYPVSYTDEHGRRATAWETTVRNCWGGATRVSSVPNRLPQRALGNREPRLLPLEHASYIGSESARLMELKESVSLSLERYSDTGQHLTRFTIQEAVVKAIRVHEFGGPEVMKLEEVTDLLPGPGQVVVRVHAAGVNPVESYIRTGTYAIKPALPYTPGNDAAGVVTAVGAGVTRVKPGDRVYTSAALSGTYAEQALCLEAQVHSLPDNVSFEQGAVVGVAYGTAYRSLFQRGDAKPGETVLVHGASGGVGTAAVQFARAAGMVVIGTAGSDAGLKLVKEQGAHHALDHSTEGYLDEVMKITDGRGVDLVLEMLANKNLAKDLSILAKKGRVVVIGNRGTVEINPRETMAREADIRGVMLFGASEQEFRQMHAALIAGLENGTLRPVIAQKIPLAEAARAHAEVMKPSGALGKIVLVT